METRVEKTKRGFHFAGLLALVFSLFLTTVSAAVVPGKWNSNFSQAKAYAEANNLPLIVFWGNPGCSACATLTKAVATDEFVSWMGLDAPSEEGANFIFVHVEGTGTSDSAACKAFAKTCNGNVLSDYPFIRIHWVKRDGGVVSVNFTGRSSRLSGSGTLAGKFIATIERYTWKMGGLSDVQKYTGGYFAVTNLPDARLEAERTTRYVDVPVYRSAKDATNQILSVIDGSITNETVVNWAADQMSQLVRVNMETNKFHQGAVINLRLMNGDDVMSETAIVSTNMANAVDNPYWIGERTAETLAWGDWTMDLDVAKSKTAATPGSRTLVIASGVLWCPYCKSLESKVLKTTAFKDWARTNNIALVVLDNPKRSPDDVRDANRQWTEVGKLANGAPPTLLRYDEGSGVSGAAYLSRKMIATNDAERVLQRNHDLLYHGGALVAPEALCTGYPTLILLNADGSVAGRLLDACDSSNTAWGLTAEQTITRLNDLLLVTGNEAESKPSTTPLAYSVEGTATASLQVNENTKFYRLTNVPVGDVTFTGESEKTVTLKIYETASTLAAATLLASGTQQVTCVFNSSTNKWLAVTAYPDGLQDYGSDTKLDVKLTSRVTLEPSEVSGAFTPTAPSVGMKVQAGVSYRFSGVDAASLTNFTGNASGEWTAKETGTAVLAPETVGGTIHYQIWRPGTIAFTVPSQRFLESASTGSVSVTRAGGVSGSAAVTVRLTQAPSTAGRVTIAETTELVWNEGETGVKTVPYSVTVDSVYQSDEIFVLQLEKTASGENAAVLGSITNHAVTVSDTDTPVLEKTEYALRLFKNFETEQIYPIYNIRENGRITLKRVSGSLPSGVSLKYDKDSNSLVLAGRPSRTGTYEYALTISERRSAGTSVGLVTTFRITVAASNELDPEDEDYNGYIGSAVKTDVPLYCEKNEKTILGGILSVSIANNNRISAKFSGASSRSVSFSGYWQTVSNGTAEAVLSTRNGESLWLALDADGYLSAELEGLTTDLGASFASGEGGVRAVADLSALAKYAGLYTVTLPVNASTPAVSEETAPMGTGFVVLKMNTSAFLRTGKVSYTGMFADGSSFTGSTTLSADAFTDDEDSTLWAAVPIFKRTSKGIICASLRVKANAATTYESNPMVVLADDTVCTGSIQSGVFRPLEVYGGYYDPKMDLMDCCEAVYETESFTSEFDTTWFAPSLQYGEIVSLPDAVVTVGASSRLTVQNANALKFTVSLSKSTGIVSGKIPVEFSTGRRVTLSYKGVLLPRWHDCGCTDVAPIERPFMSGAAFYTDREGRTSVKRGFAVNLRPLIDD